jgi:hypothetical protein
MAHNTSITGYLLDNFFKSEAGRSRQDQTRGPVREPSCAHQTHPMGAQRGSGQSCNACGKDQFCGLPTYLSRQRQSGHNFQYLTVY